MISTRLKINICFLALIIIAISFFYFVTPVFAETPDQLEQNLREQLERIEREEAEVQKTLNVQKAKSATIERDVNILTGQIKQSQLSIEKKNINIVQLGDDIALRDNTVKQLNEKMNRGKTSLSQLIKKTNELDHISLTEILLAEGNLSDFFVNLDTYLTIRDSLESLFDEIREIRGLTEEEKEKLARKRLEEQDVKAEIVYEQRKVKVKEGEKKSVLALSKQTEATYEQVLAEKRARANAIRTALFQLRDSTGISFGDALRYAETASKATGVRAAFILAILKQESDLGKNVGTCNRPGDPESKKWYSIMPGPNDNSWRDDQAIFLKITKQLGLDPETTPLSCPLAGGWGGAMGPSQFIPATWDAYSGRVASAVGVSVASPWNPEHAFTATALYVRDLGAAAGGYSAEKTAALKYYAGSNWNLPKNQFYGNSVSSHATDFQEQINFLKEVN